MTTKEFGMVLFCLGFLAFVVPWVCGLIVMNFKFVWRFFSPEGMTMKPDKARLRIKPSQRIYQIIGETRSDPEWFEKAIESIIKYLDEEYEIACDEATHDFNVKHFGDDVL